MMFMQITRTYIKMCFCEHLPCFTIIVHTNKLLVWFHYSNTRGQYIYSKIKHELAFYRRRGIG